MKKVLSILLAIFCVMNLTVVSFAAEEVSYFDEETGTLYLMSENWIEDLEIEETDEAVLTFCEKVKVLYVDEGYNINNGAPWVLFINLEKVILDEDFDDWFVYDNAIYGVFDGVCIFVYYPPKCADKDIVMHPDATQFSVESFLFWDSIKEVYLPNNNEYNLYIVEEGQFEKLKENFGTGIGNMMYHKFDNIYVNDTQESIDEIIEILHYTLETLNKDLTVQCFSSYYGMYHLDEEISKEVSDKMKEIWEEVEEPEDTDDLVAVNEYYDTIHSNILDYISTLSYEEYTEEIHAQKGRAPEEYEFFKSYIDFFYDRFSFFRDRGNPVKPLSTLTSGTCGEGVEWAIDRENGVLSITGNGAIADNYSGFDVFKGIVTTVEIGNGITAIGENVFTGFTAITETKFDGTQAQWDAVAVAEGNDDLLKNVTVNPDPIVEPEEEPTLGDKIVGFFNKISNFFIKVFDWFKNLLGI